MRSSNRSICDTSNARLSTTGVIIGESGASLAISDELRRSPFALRDESVSTTQNVIEPLPASVDSASSVPLSIIGFASLGVNARFAEKFVKISLTIK